MPERTEGNPNELNQDDARYGFRCCHLINFFFHAEDGIRDVAVTGVQTCALPISHRLADLLQGCNQGWLPDPVADAQPARPKIFEKVRITRRFGFLPCRTRGSKSTGSSRNSM